MPVRPQHALTLQNYPRAPIQFPSGLVVQFACQDGEVEEEESEKEKVRVWGKSRVQG